MLSVYFYLIVYELYNRFFFWSCLFFLRYKGVENTRGSSDPVSTKYQGSSDPVSPSYSKHALGGQFSPVF
jgi:hypothetical protein